MSITTIFNVVYVIRHAVSTENNAFITPSKISLIGNSLANASDNQSATTYGLLDETYQMFLQVFTANIMMILDRRNTSSSYCPLIPSNLKGPIMIQEPPENFSLLDISPYYPEVQHGGHYHPKICVARHKIAIIVPYRDRWDILRRFLFHTHEFLQRQQLDYRIYVCEQAFDSTFNKGIVMNSCFKEILNLEPNTPCFIMHDVDLLLIDDRNMYTCPLYPRHLSVAIDKFDFYLPYPELVGGVLAMRREHYILVNGYSTNYWGWGGEDDDMYKRITKKHLILERPPASIARYKMLKHTHQKLNPSRMKVLRTAHIRIDSDGVNNVKYKLLNITLHHLYTHFLIDVGQPKRS
ncbi:unnamed protein product [Rotaria sp. Silwood1]|nr:unnamed protein product [Rotaria sp. Silwood1]CAF0917091.1 unnamed protein product [Rotaria sp. Silwood1]CAF0943494.1 unnamed protein product [Rotaria sp. Silwood1]CAF3383212.1 unnamed protein product [Rotaria sp. Silwood1]CAF3398577.1 unnamed protein product [Rotaria sp. Silwood1]